MHVPHTSRLKGVAQYIPLYYSNDQCDLKYFCWLRLRRSLRLSLAGLECEDDIEGKVANLALRDGRAKAIP